jgi:hypothetical protein
MEVHSHANRFRPSRKIVAGFVAGVLCITGASHELANNNTEWGVLGDSFGVALVATAGYRGGREYQSHQITQYLRELRLESGARRAMLDQIESGIRDLRPGMDNFD